MVADLELRGHEAVARGCGGLADGGGGAGTSGLRQVRAHLWIYKKEIVFMLEYYESLFVFKILNLKELKNNSML